RNELRASLVGALANDERERRMTTTGEGSDHLAIFFDDGNLAALLPKGEWLLLDHLDRKRRGINLADGYALDPGKLGYALPGLAHVEAHHRRPTIEAHLLKHIDLGGFPISGDLHIIDRKADPGGDRLQHLFRMTTLDNTVDAGRHEQSQTYPG